MILKCRKSEISIENETSLVSKLEDFLKLESVIRLEKSNGTFIAVTPTGDDTFTFEYKENDQAFLCLEFYPKEVVTEVFLNSLEMKRVGMMVMNGKKLQDQAFGL